jgi:hypothetical protein
MLVRPSRKSVLLDAFPFGVCLQITFGVGHGFVGVDHDERIGGVDVVVVVAVAVRLAASSGEKVESRRRISTSVSSDSKSWTQWCAVRKRS